MKKWILPLLFVSLSFYAVAQSSSHELLIAPGTLTDHSANLLWNEEAGKAAEYEILLNDKKIGSGNKTNYELSNLKPATAYKVSIKEKGKQAKLHSIEFTTPAKGKVFNIIDFGAKADSSFKNTKAIQAAIDACTDGGTVYIPKGKWVSGALFLKSHMTLYIEKGAVLQGSAAVEDYLPMIPNRFEGWELDTYASLLNAGKLDRNGGYNVTDLRITGGGTISGGGQALGNAMIKASGIRSRGRLILLMNCQDVSISHLTISQPPSWTIHYIYSDNISCSDLHIITYGIHNGDGIDPDSSTDSYIFNCLFDTGDDCIAIKSGKNPEGYYVGKPTTNVRVTNCSFVRGHGISIGSEMSGGVSDVLVQDCKAGALINGMQIKGTKERGGYVRNVTVVDCELLQITVFSKLNYNNDGEAAPTPPTFENFVFKNIDLSKANDKKPVIDINGFKDTDHKLKHVRFENVVVPEKSKVKINDGEDIQFINVKTPGGAKPEYVVEGSEGIRN